jgi:SH3-like domain-containing protein
LPDLRRDGCRRRALSANAIRVIACAASVLLLLVAAGRGPAAAADNEKSLPVPRFVSLHADRVNLRTGPGSQYPIEWVLTKKEMPVQIIAQFEHWRRIRDWEGAEGWVQERMVAGKRTVVVNKGGLRPLYQQPDPATSVIARAEPGAVARLAECRGPWCRVETDDVSGWMRRSDIWGVFPDETVP